MKNCSEKFCFRFDPPRNSDSEMDSIKNEIVFFLKFTCFSIKLVILYETGVTEHIEQGILKMRLSDKNEIKLTQHT